MEDRLTFIMKAKNLSMTKFADEIDVQRSNMSHVMNGRNKASLDFIRRILKRYPDINPDWLLFGKGGMTRDDNQQALADNDETSELLAESEAEKTALQEEVTGLKKTIARLQANPEAAGTDSELQDEDPPAYGTQKTIEQMVIFYHDKTFRIYRPDS